jgi:hypothetical protein
MTSHFISRPWEDEARALIAEGWAASRIAAHVGVTKNVIIGWAYRREILWPRSWHSVVRHKTHASVTYPAPLGCRWIDGDPMVSDWHWCDARPSRPGSSWCAAHRARVYIRIQGDGDE